MELADKVRSRHVWRLAWPNIVSTLMLTSIGLAHIKLVAHYGADSVAAVSSGHRVFFLLQALLIGLSAAITALVARHWGSGDHAAAARSARASLNLSMLLAVVAGILFYVTADYIAAAFGLDGEPAAMTSRYIQVMVLFNMAYALSLVLGTAIRSVGDAQTPMRYSMVATAFNVFLCWVFINGHLGAPAMGATGAALAGGIAPLVIYAVLTWRWWAGKLALPYSSESGKHNYGELVRIGTPAAIEQLIIQASLIMFMALVSNYGTAAFAAYGLGITILSAVIVVGYGFSIAGATLVAQYIGSRNPEQAYQSAMRTLKLTLLAMTALAILCFIFARPVSHFMVGDPVVVDAAVQFMWVLAGVMPIMAVEVSLAGALRGAGDTRTPLTATFSGLTTRLLGGLLMVFLEAPVVYLYAMLFLDYGVKVLILVWEFRKGRWLDGKHP